MKKVELSVEGLGFIGGNIPKDIANRAMMMVLEGLNTVLEGEVNNDSNVDKKPEGRALKQLDYNPFANNDYFDSSRLVAHRCEDCGRITIRRMHLMETNITSCHWCKKESRVHTVARVDVKCSSCDSSYYVWTANSLDEIECKDCQAPNDLVYYDNGRKGCTPNLRY